MGKKKAEPIGKLVVCSINTEYNGILSKEKIAYLKNLSYHQFLEWRKSDEAKEIPMTLSDNYIYEDTTEMGFSNEDMDDFMCWFVPNEKYHLPKVIGFVFKHVDGFITPKDFSDFVNSLSYEQCYALSMFDLRVEAFADKNDLVACMNHNDIRKDTGTIIHKYLRLF